MTEDVYIIGIDMIKFGRFPNKSVPEKYCSMTSKQTKLVQSKDENKNFLRSNNLL